MNRTYKCKKCGPFNVKYRAVSQVQREKPCPLCGQESYIVLELPTIQFKGEGFTRKEIH